MAETIEVSFTQDLTTRGFEALFSDVNRTLSVSMTVRRPSLWRHPVRAWRWHRVYGWRTRQVVLAIPRAELRSSDG